ncbi:MAG: TatD family hydrolase [Spirochaetales bacterium]|nr:TatD family hydrolase [Spirochaetales bacterium]
MTAPGFPLPLIDIGCNLLHPSFNSDRTEVLERAHAAGVRILVVTGTSAASSREAADFAGSRPGILYATAGVHPHDARHFGPGTLAELEALAGRPEVVAVGECGLDFNRDFSPRPAQERAFELQLELAARVGKPLFMHERGAHARFVDILRSFHGRIGRCVVHCFTGTAEEASLYLDLGLHIGITGWICDERRGRHLAEVVRHIPLDRLMLETDAPFLVPRTLPSRPSRNEPAFLPEVLRVTAAALDRNEAEVAEATTRTAGKFFGIGVS